MLSVFIISVLFKIREQDGFIEQNVWRFEVWKTTRLRKQCDRTRICAYAQHKRIAIVRRKHNFRDNKRNVGEMFSKSW